MVPDHDCNQFSTSDFETGEEICIKCGVVSKGAEICDNHVEENIARCMSAIDHNAGNDLLNSQTENMDYVSYKNKGLAYRINKGGRDYLGKKVKTSLHNSYLSGNIAGGKAIVLKEDPLTHEVSFKFDFYDKPMLTMIKERVMSEISLYGLNTVEMTIIAKECKRLVSQLFFSEMLEYAWRAAVLNAGVLKEKDALALEQKMYQLTEPIRVKILSHCNKELAAEIKKPAQALEARQ